MKIKTPTEVRQLIEEKRRNNESIEAMVKSFDDFITKNFIKELFWSSDHFFEFRFDGKSTPVEAMIIFLNALLEAGWCISDVALPSSMVEKLVSMALSDIEHGFPSGLSSWTDETLPDGSFGFRISFPPHKNN